MQKLSLVHYIMAFIEDNGLAVAVLPFGLVRFGRLVNNVLVAATRQVTQVTVA